MVKPTQLEPLRDGIIEALELGIDGGGASIDDFRHLDGARGSFQDDFLVHRRGGCRAPDCGSEMSREDGGRRRGTYACEVCQPPPRTLPRSARRLT